MSQAKLPATMRMSLSQRRRAVLWIAQSKNMCGRGHSHHPNPIREGGYRVIYRIREDVPLYTRWTTVMETRAEGTVAHRHAYPYESLDGGVLRVNGDRRFTHAVTADLPGQDGPYQLYRESYAAPRPWGTA